MTTKAQERKALEQIRKIVEGLGEDSYIGTAFEGCFEIAEENIENDFACSMKQRKEAAEFAEDQLREKLAEKEKEVKELNETIDLNAKIINELHERIEKLREAKLKAQDEAIKNKKEVFINVNNGDSYDGCPAQVKYIDNNGFRFVTITEESGWTVSYKLDDIKEITIG